MKNAYQLNEYYEVKLSVNAKTYVLQFLCWFFGRKSGTLL